MTRKLAVVLSLVITLYGAYASGAIAHANSYANCTGNPSACTGGATCRTFPKNAILGGTDTTPVGVCLQDGEYQSIQAGIAAKSAGTPSSGGTVGGPTSQTNGTLGSPTPGSGTQLANPLKYSDLNSLLTAVLNALIQIGSILLTLAIVWVGFRFVAARGNEEAIRSARSALMWTVIGGLILLGATAIQAVITSTVGAITP